jgi:hypothetical protein
MKQRRFEIFIAVILTIICYLGYYYLKEATISSVAKHSLAWHTANIFWLFMMVILGYWGLKNHELQWIKTVWIVVNVFFMFLLFTNKVIEHFFHYRFIPEATSSLIRTPFFFLMAAFLPRWFKGNKPVKEN